MAKGKGEGRDGLGRLDERRGGENGGEQAQPATDGRQGGGIHWG